ncbi:hypothetical protein [Nocardia salmonicida]|uniref:hypothetical protein n=1 Tax=Nocardia salmonicida TaxID=53431 RepID=UPI0033DBFC30
MYIDAEVAAQLGVDPEPFDGVYSVVLNELIEIRFIPDVSAVFPSSEILLFDEECPVITARDARLWSLRSSDLNVTVNSILAPGEGAVPLFPGWAGTGDSPADGTAWFVGTEEWSELMVQLRQLELETSFNNPTFFSELSGTPLARLLADRILPSNRLPSGVLEVLGRLGKT